MKLQGAVASGADCGRAGKQLETTRRNSVPPSTSQHRYITPHIVTHISNQTILKHLITLHNGPN